MKIKTQTDRMTQDDKNTSSCILPVLGMSPYIHRHTAVHLRNVSVKAEVLAWLSCNLLIHHASQLLIPHPFMSADHHSFDVP